MIKSRLVLALFVAAAVAPVPAPAARPESGGEARDVASLTVADVNEIRAGGGWGLARPAELNGYPGPRHVLDLGQELKLDDSQKVAVAAVFARMNGEARRVGAAYVEAERAVDQAFRSGRVDGDSLVARLAEAGRLRDRLRQVHLAAHLETAPILSPEQRRLYRHLRGYDGGASGTGQRHPHPAAGPR